MLRERQIKAGTTGGANTRVYFFLTDATDYVTPETGEAGGQPQISTNGAAWTATGIGTLVSIGNGSYYADLTTGAVATAGQIILTRYKSSNTSEARGTSVITTVYAPSSETQTVSLGTSTIGTAQLVDGAITAAKFAANAITSTIVADNTITAAKIGADAITNAKISGDLQSDNFVAGSAGWRIRKSTGEAEFRNITLRGQVEDIRSYTAGNYEVYGDRGIINNVGQTLNTWRKHREIRCARSGTVRVTYGWASLYNASGAGCKVEKNGTYVQADYAPTSAFDRLLTVDVSVVAGDLISQWLYLPSGYGGNIVYTHTLALSSGIIFNESTSFRLVSD
mgnify:CR=1 FL=1